MKKPALLLSLLALGTLGLVACGGGDNGETAAASETETARDRTSCGDFRIAPRGEYPLIKVAVVEGDVPCRRARRVLKDFYQGDVDNLGASESYLGPLAVVGSWSCGGPEGHVVCKRKPGTASRTVITARFAAVA